MLLRKNNKIPECYNQKILQVTTIVLHAFVTIVVRFFLTGKKAFFDLLQSNTQKIGTIIIIKSRLTFVKAAFNSKKR